MNKFWQYNVNSNTEDGEGGGSGGGEVHEQDQSTEKGSAAESSEGGQQGYWPDDWQDRLSKGDEQLAKRIGRYSSPEAVAEALIATQNKLRSGELKSVLPEKPTDEELSEWRKENGIPESADKYDLTFGSGLVIGDEDKPFIDEFLKVAHETNQTPEQVKQSIEWYFQQQERQAEERLELDNQESRETSDKLHNEWGKDYRRNINLIEGVLNRFPEEVRDSLKSARLGDGTAVFNSPEVLKGFADLALEINPAATVVPHGSGNPAQTIDDEIKDIKEVMRTDRAKYNREKLDIRLQELYTAKEKMAS